jgi:hypothetical protein
MKKEIFNIIPQPGPALSGGQQRQNGRDGSLEYANPAPLWCSVRSRSGLPPEREEKSPVYHESENSRIYKRFHYMALLGRNIVDAIMRFQLFKHKLYFPSSRISSGNILWGKLFGRNVGDIEMVFSRLFISCPHQSEALEHFIPLTTIGSSRDADFNLSIKRFPLQPRQDVFQLSCFDGLASASMRSVREKDFRIGIVLESGDKESTIPLHSLEEAGGIIAHIKEKKPILHPLSNSHQVTIPGPFREQADAPGADSKHTEDDVKLHCRLISMISSGCVNIFKHIMQSEDRGISNHEILKGTEFSFKSSQWFRKLVAGVRDGLFHKPAQLGRESVVERRRNKLHTGAALIKPSQFSDGLVGASAETQYNGPEKVNDIDLSLALYQTCSFGSVHNPFPGKAGIKCFLDRISCCGHILSILSKGVDTLVYWPFIMFVPSKMALC